MDGKPQLNFFSGHSPLHPFFMTMIGVTGVLLALFLGFTIISSLQNGKSSPIKKMGRFFMSSTAIFAVPTIFLMVLSLTGALMGAINGKAINMSRNDVVAFQNYTEQLTTKLKNINPSNSAFDKNAQLGAGDILDKNGNIISQGQIDYTMDIERIYETLIKENVKGSNEFDPSSDIRSLAERARDAYKVLMNLIITNKAGSLSLSDILTTGINNVEDIITKLTPQLKNESYADKVRDVINNFNKITDALANFKSTSDELLSYLPQTPAKPQDFALKNYQTIFEQIWGNKDENQLQSETSIGNLQQFAFELGSLIHGGISLKDFQPGLFDLRQRLSSFEDSSLVITFYQLITGNNDTNWDKTFSSLQNGGFMILVGFGLIIGAIIILALVIIEAFIRAVILAALFIVSPIVLGTSVLDDGARMKTWISVVMGQLISIFGVIIILRLSGILTSKFTVLLDSSGEFAGSGTGMMTRCILIALFAYASLVAAYRSKSLFASIAGHNNGILDAMQAGNHFKRILGKSAAIASNIGSAIGLSSKANSNPGNTGNTRMSNFKQTWSKRNPLNVVAASNKALANVSGGKLGTTKARNDALENRINKVKAKTEASANRKAINLYETKKSLEAHKLSQTQTHLNSLTSIKKASASSKSSFKKDKENKK